MDVAQDHVDTKSLKRKRSVDKSPPNYATPSVKGSRTVPTPAQLEINYLARLTDNDLPLVTTDDPLPSILAVLSEYSEVLERRESLAYNLGARPLGPILVKRFERLFDGPPTTLNSHIGRDGQPTKVSWLDVIESVRADPDHLTLTQSSQGARVYELYAKQCRVQISEEDYLLVQSGLPQKMIPPQPIAEDEEKELATLDIVERNVQQITSLADQVAARARQLNHRLRSRKQAIIDRRASEAVVGGAAAMRAASPSSLAAVNGVALTSHMPLSSFVPINSQLPGDQHAELQSTNGFLDSTPIQQSTRDELLKSFFTLADRRQVQSGSDGNLSLQPANSSRLNHTSKISRPSAAPRTTHYDEQHLAASLLSYDSGHPQSPSTPLQSASLPAVAHAQSTRASTAEREDGGLFRAEMVARLETLRKGERILPPCDRCRRLHMECTKNLTACIGCTKKHAKCSWKDIREEELRTFSRTRLASTNNSDSDPIPTDKRQRPRPKSPSGEPSSDQQELLQQPHHFNQEYTYGKQYRSHDEEMQAARSLAMAAVADAATQEQMQLQKDAAASNGQLNPDLHSGLTALSHGNREHSNLDPSLRPADGTHATRA